MLFSDRGSHDISANRRARTAGGGAASRHLLDTVACGARDDGGWLLLFAVNRRVSAAELSKTLFVALGVLALGFCLFAGVFLTADCLSEEKREGTLGLLFLTVELTA